LVFAQRDVVELGLVEAGPDLGGQSVSLVGQRLDLGLDACVGRIARRVAGERMRRSDQGVHREGPEGRHQLLVGISELLHARMVCPQADG
jgi:hypothetical protein